MDGRSGFPKRAPGFAAVLTALPSATSFSRASLLCGRLIARAQNVEKRGFQDNVDLRTASRPGTPPVLFHKMRSVQVEVTWLSL